MIIQTFTNTTLTSVDIYTHSQFSVLPFSYGAAKEILSLICRNVALNVLLEIIAPELLILEPLQCFSEVLINPSDCA